MVKKLLYYSKIFRHSLAAAGWPAGSWPMFPPLHECELLWTTRIQPVFKSQIPSVDVPHRNWSAGVPYCSACTVSTGCPENKLEIVPPSFCWTACEILIFIMFHCCLVINVRYLFPIKDPRVMGKDKRCGGMGKFIQGYTGNVVAQKFSLLSPDFLCTIASALGRF